MQVLKDKFKNSLNDFVYLGEEQMDIDILTLASIGSTGETPYWLKTKAITTPIDKFGHAGPSETNPPLYRLKKGVKEALATGDPQWILFKLVDPIDHSYGGSVRLMDNFVSRFNYDFVYNYFFGKDKPTTPYQPITGANVEERGSKTTPMEPSETAKKNAADRTVLFFEDFSITAVGAIPANWKISRSQDGNTAEVQQINGSSGKWLKLKGQANPINFSQPISGDFEFNCDLLVQKGDVPWGTPGIEIELKFSAEKKVSLNVTPGDMNRTDAAGWITFGGLTNCKVSSYYSVSGFSGDKPVNKAMINLIRKGQNLLVLCNKTKVYECNTAFSPDMILKDLRFAVSERNQYYVSNVMIKRLK